MSRRRVSTRDRVALFTREGGRCHHCLGLVTPGQAWQLSHKIPLALGGADDESNWGVIHTRPCHEQLTRTVDVPAIARAKRREAAHLGAKVSAGSLRSRGFSPPAPKDRTVSKAIPRKPIYEDAET
jgi:5-methylcytosine-specific restriction endonuclease McrA